MRWFLLAAGITLWAGMTFDSITRVRTFTPDSMLYVDAARNLRAGQGLSSSVLGLNEVDAPRERTIPYPLTHYAPLYPLAIAGASLLGPAPPEAALLIAALCGLLVVLLGFALARRAWGEPTALLAAAFLVLYGPLREATNTAWSEPIALALLFASFLTLPGVSPSRRHWERIALSGLFAGLAFATRYALLPVIAFGPLVLLVRERPWRRATAAAALWGASALLPVAAVIAHNVASGHPPLPDAPASTLPLSTNLATALKVVFGAVLERWSWRVEAAGACALLALGLVVAWRRDRSPAPALRALVGGDAGVLAAWTLLYFLFLVVERSRREFDVIDERLMLPCGVTAVLLAAAWTTRGLGLGRKAAAAALVVAIGFACAREARVFTRLPARTTASTIANSPLLTWIARHTTPRDLVIGDNTLAMSFYVPRRAVLFWRTRTATMRRSTVCAPTGLRTGASTTTAGSRSTASSTSRPGGRPRWGRGSRGSLREGILRRRACGSPRGSTTGTCSRSRRRTAGSSESRSSALPW